MDQAMADLSGVHHEGLAVTGMDSANPWSVVRALLQLPVAILMAMLLLRRFSPDVVVGTAGYVCVPVVLAAWVFRKPIILLEQNRHPGKAIRLLSRFASVVATSYEETRNEIRRVRAVTTGNPVRASILALKPAEGGSCTRILVMGGSQGAHRLNVALSGCILDLLTHYPAVFVVHQTGARDFAEMVGYQASLPEEIRERYTVKPFIQEIAEVIAASGLVVMRAGGSSLAECAVLGRPMILVPYPHASGHQVENALPYVHKGAAVMVIDAECTPVRMYHEITALLEDRDRWAAMAAASRACGVRDATTRVLSLISEMVA